MPDSRLIPLLLSKRRYPILAIREKSQSERLALRVMPVSRCSDLRDISGVGEKGKTSLLSGVLKALYNSQLVIKEDHFFCLSCLNFIFVNSLINLNIRECFLCDYL